MKQIKGKTLAQHIRNNLTSNNWVEVNDYDLKLYLKLANSNQSCLFLFDGCHIAYSPTLKKYRAYERPTAVWLERTYGSKHLNDSLTLPPKQANINKKPALTNNELHF